MKKVVLFLAILACSGFSWAATTFTCDSNLLIVDHSQQYGVTSESASAAVAMSQNLRTYNYNGLSTLVFGRGQYKLYVSFEAGAPSDPNTWVSQTEVLVQKSGTKENVLGAVTLPNTYYGQGMIAPEEVEVGNGAVFSQIPNLPEILANGDPSLQALSGLKDGSVLGTTTQCYRTTSQK